MLVEALAVFIFVFVVVVVVVFFPFFRTIISCLMYVKFLVVISMVLTIDDMITQNEFLIF